MLNNFADISPDRRIIVALDCERDEACDLAQKLQGCASWIKIGMTLFYAYGPSIIADLKQYGFHVFLDLKLHDIPHQVEGAAAAIAACGADLLTVHAAGGRAMMEAACRGAFRAAQSHHIAPPALLAVTVLTSMSDVDLADIGCANTMTDQVLHLATQARISGLAGVVASPQEASMLRDSLGSDALIVTPGVRPVGSDMTDQSRVATPMQAFAAGASHIVIGRPITQAEDPRAAYNAIVESLV